MQAILTRALGPTDRRNQRIIARAWAGSLTVEWEAGLGIEENHKAAARAFARKFDWIHDNYGALVTGCIYSGDYTHVFTQRGAQQNGCDGEGPHELGELRVYPLGANSNAILCRACYTDLVIHDPARTSERVEPFDALKLYGSDRA